VKKNSSSGQRTERRRVIENKKVARSVRRIDAASDAKKTNPTDGLAVFHLLHATNRVLQFIMFAQITAALKKMPNHETAQHQSVTRQHIYGF
jgi:hypothetical protein